MQRRLAWIVAVFLVAIALVLVIRPDARTADRDPVLVGVPVSPTVPLQLEACPSVDAREQFERKDCFQSVRIELLDGDIDLEEALDRLAACASLRDDLSGLASRARILKRDERRARVAFGLSLDASDGVGDRVEDDLPGVEPGPPPAPDAVARLRAAGISPDGFAAGQEAEILERLEAESTLRAAFRDVFGSLRADALDAMLDGSERGMTAVTVGATTIIPNQPAAYPTPDGAVDYQENSDGPRAVSTAAYAARLIADLEALEVSRQRYLASAGTVHQNQGSVRAWFTSLRSFGEDDAGAAELQARAAQDRAALAAQLANFSRQMGADPLIARMAGESVGLVTEIDRSCRSVADHRRNWMRTGAGVVTGLVGAAGVVIATGATGTLIGGVTIAAALEASLGAYLIAMSERVDVAIPSSANEQAVEAAEAVEETRFQPAGLEHSIDSGEEGHGSGDHDVWYEDLGERVESDAVEGEGIEAEDGDGNTETRPRSNPVPPILPIEIPEELTELPPLLEHVRLRLTSDLSLPEIQERLDDFLAASDPAAWEKRAEEAEVDTWSARRLIDEAQLALKLWETRRRLSDGFAEFFIQAELERIPAERRADVLRRAMGRYLHDREFYATSGSLRLLRDRVASRLVAHCRAGSVAGDLALSACTNETALSILLVAAIHDAQVEVPYGSVLGIQVFPERVETVLYSKKENRVYSLTRGDEFEGVVAPIYHPATFYYTYLVSHGTVPEIDLDEHLLIALPDRPLPEGLEIEECIPESNDRGVLGRAVEWVGAMFGIRRVKAEESNCASAEEVERARAASRGGSRSVGLSIPTPRNPVQRGGGGEAGGGQGGGGAGGGNPLARNAPGDPLASGSGSASSDSGEQGGEGQGESGSSTGSTDAEGSGGSGAGSSEQGREDAGSSSTAATSSDGGSEGAAGGSQGAADSGDSASEGGAGSGGYGIASVSLPSSPNLTSIGRETVRTSHEYRRAGSLPVMPWRLRDDEGMATGSTSRVLYADNPRALERFDEDDLFITLAPAEVEAQRRMQEADGFPIYPAETTCDAANLPPRRVFRRAASGDPGYRYVFCDHDESMVIFRDQDDAEAYAQLSAPDRPLYLARLASERIARFERSEAVGRLMNFLEDPNAVADWSREEIYATVKAAADLLVFQNALESALVQSMNELGPSRIRSYYFDMHREVMQAPFFVEVAERVYRLNQRLASDPLQSLAWANVQEPLARQGFFDIYFTIGRIMEWPERWATLEQRYGNPDIPPPAIDPDAPSLDFLQVMSDPNRVRVDWTEERASNPSIRDRKPQDGIERTQEVVDRATLSDLVQKEDDEEHRRGGTGGTGRAGKGDSKGPEEGRRPLQMVLIRIVPDDSDPDRPQVPDDNQVRPGGTEGGERRQTEESASRQEPVLWLSPHTFIEAILSNWDSRDLRPESSERIPPIVRFNERLREVFLRDLLPVEGVYDNRLRSAMETFTRSGWLRYAEVREAMGGTLTAVRAYDVGRFSGAYSGNAPVNDQDQIRIPNFFNTTGVVIPRDLFGPVREHYTRTVLGIFDLVEDDRIPPPIPLEVAPLPPEPEALEDRERLLSALEFLREEALAD